MTISLIILSLATLYLGITIIGYLMSIKNSSVPFCLSWLARGVVSACFFAIFIFIYLFGFLNIYQKHSPFIILVAEYFSLSIYYLYALWQTKFMVYKSKTWQKSYILIINIFLCTVGFKYIVKTTTGLFDTEKLSNFINRQVSSSLYSQHISSFICLAFFILYIIYCISNRYNEYSKISIRNTVKALYWSLGIMILWDVIQVYLTPILCGTYNKGIFILLPITSVEYQKFFEINCIIKLSLNLIYMIFIYYQIKVDKGHFMDDSIINSKHKEVVHNDK